MVELRTAAYYHRLYPYSLVATQLQYRVKIRGRWSRWIDVPMVEAKDSPRIKGRNDMFDYQQAHRERKRASDATPSTRKA